MPIDRFATRIRCCTRGQRRLSENQLGHREAKKVTCIRCDPKLIEQTADTSYKIQSAQTMSEVCPHIMLSPMSAENTMCILYDVMGAVCCGAKELIHTFALEGDRLSCNRASYCVAVGHRRHPSDGPRKSRDLRIFPKFYAPLFHRISSK